VSEVYEAQQQQKAFDKAREATAKKGFQQAEKQAKKA
jgi:hypothetical protein